MKKYILQTWFENVVLENSISWNILRWIISFTYVCSVQSKYLSFSGSIVQKFCYKYRAKEKLTHEWFVKWKRKQLKATKYLMIHPEMKNKFFFFNSNIYNWNERSTSVSFSIGSFVQYYTNFIQRKNFFSQANNFLSITIAIIRKL